MGASRSRRSRVVVLAACVVALGVMKLSPAAGSSAPSGSLAHAACHHLFEKESNSPCLVGNELAQCGYAFGACENSSHLKCKESREEGKVVKVVEDKEEELETTRVENPHKTITCKGTATILEVYAWENRTYTHRFQVVAHGTHSLVTKLYPLHRFRADGLTVMAQS
jgi:hypothetical protein